MIRLTVLAIACYVIWFLIVPSILILLIISFWTGGLAMVMESIEKKIREVKK